MMNRVLITGGPGTGKTSLINELKKNGYNCSEEIVRKITLTKRKEGHKQYFLSNPLIRFELHSSTNFLLAH